MNRKDVIKYCLELPNVYEDYPFPDDEYLDSLNVEEKYEKMGGKICGENIIKKGEKEYKEVGFKYNL